MNSNPFVQKQSKCCEDQRVSTKCNCHNGRNFNSRNECKIGSFNCRDSELQLIKCFTSNPNHFQKCLTQLKNFQVCVYKMADKYPFNQQANAQK